MELKEFLSIVNVCKQVYLQKQMPMSQYIGKMIKQYLPGEWFVIVSNSIQKKYDFAVSSVEDGDYMCFSLDNTLFQVVKISD